MDEEGLEMETIVRPLEHGQRHTLVEVEIITGRTHQIRAHLAKAGHPVIGDVKYGDKRVNGLVRQRFDLNAQLLHAYNLHFEGCGGELAYLNGKTVFAELPMAETGETVIRFLVMMLQKSIKTFQKCEIGIDIYLKRDKHIKI